jgi:single-strand DNA-binding protein
MEEFIMLNRTILQGRLVSDPELRETGTGIKLATFTLAVGRPYRKDKESQTDFFDIVAWRGTGEFVVRNFHKGDMALVDGKLETDTYEDRDGKKRKTYRIIADEVLFDGKNDKPSADAMPTVPVADGDMEEVDTDDDLPF